MRELKRIAFLMEDFALPSSAQQLLDRFLIGFNQHGEFRRPNIPIVLSCAQEPDGALLRQRREDFGLALVADPTKALQAADAVVVAGAVGGLAAEQRIRLALEQAPASTPIFVQGLLANSRTAAEELTRLARDRDCPLLAGTAVPFAFRLPPVTVPDGARLRDALIVVQGQFPAAELDGLEGLLPVLERRKNSHTGVRRLRYLDGEEVWRAGGKDGWSWPLLASALSRSHTPQGNAVLDGRTEDLVGLELVPKLCVHPRAWLLEHSDGLRSAILVLDGVVADINFAVGLQNGTIVSAQLFRAPPPQQEHYSPFAAALLDFFVSGRSPWPLERAITEASVAAAMRSAEGRGGGWMQVA